MEIKFLFQIECGLIKRPFATARYWPNLIQGRQRRAEDLPYDSAEMNLDAANELMADILKVGSLNEVVQSVSPIYIRVVRLLYWSQF